MHGHLVIALVFNVVRHTCLDRGVATTPIISLLGVQRLLPSIVVRSCGTNLHKVEVVTGMLLVIGVHPALLVQPEPGEQLDN